MVSTRVAFLRGHRDLQHEAALSAIVKGLPMTKNNRLRKSISGNEDNLPGLAHVNAFPISDNADVGGVNRTRKSACSENGVIGGSSGTAFHWLLQSSWGSYVSRLSAACHLFQKSPCDAPQVPRTSSGLRPVHGCNAPGKFFQSLPGAVRQVRRMPLVGSSICGNRSAESDTLSDVNKQSESLHSTSKKCPYALVNGNYPW